MKRILLILLIVLPFTVKGQLQMVKEINTSLYGGAGKPQYLTEFNGNLIFVGTNQLGSELWKTDGTANGTVMIKDINLGSSSSLSSPVFFKMGDYLYFGATDQEHGNELWRTDGTEKGTTMVFDINAGTASSFPQRFIIYNNVMYFIATTAAEGYELWKYDGLSNPTMVADINPGTANSSPNYLTVMNNVLYFQAQLTNYGSEFWKYDGINAPEMIDINVGTGSSSPSNLTVMNNVLYFSANNGTTGAELWKYDGTNAPAIVADICTGATGSSPANLTVVNSVLYFTANDGAAVHGTELWKYDGTNTPSMVFDIKAGTASSNPAYLYASDNVLYFTATSTYNGFWVYDPASGFDPFEVTINATGSSISGNPYFTTYKGEIYFAASNASANGTEFFKYNPLTGTASLVKDINTTASGSSTPTFLTVFNNKIYFDADDKAGGVNNNEMWVSDGTDVGTSLLVDIYAGDDAVPSNFAISNNELYFSANNGLTSVGQNGTELWKTDGTSAGTSMVADINITNSLAGNSSPYYLTDVNGSLFFAATNGNDGTELFVHNNSGTSQVVNLYTGNAANNSGIEAYNLAKTPVNFKGQFYFKGLTDKTGTAEYELFKSDGTEAGTVAVTNFSNASVGVNNLVVCGDSLFWTSNDPSTNGYELWVYDGTSVSTLPAINTANNGSSVYNTATNRGALVTRYKGDYYFAGGTATTDMELYRYNKAANTSTKVADINAAGASNPVYITPCNGKLIFYATEATYGNELYYTDGTNTGLLKDIYPGATASFATAFSSFTTINDSTALFFAKDDVNGEELWKTNGTPESTVLVKDITKGSNSSSFSSYTTTLDGKMYFVVNEELWVSDGTANGTYCVARIANGGLVSASQLITYKNEIYLAGFAQNGKELYKYTPIASPSSQTSGIKDTVTSETTVTLTWDKGNGANRVIFVKLGTGTPGTAPANGVTYSANTSWNTKGTELYAGSDFYCVYNGNGTSVDLTDMVSDTVYTVYAFEYNAATGYEVYNTEIATGNSATFRIKKSQTITFGALSTKTFGNVAFGLTANASSMLDVTYLSSNTNVATISGNTVTIVGAGETTITASQSGNLHYLPAKDVLQTLTVNKADQTITFDVLPAKTFGDPAFSLTATASSGLTVSFSSNDITVATIAGDVVTILKSGTSTITASQSGNTNYNAATSVDQLLSVSPKTGIAGLSNESVKIYPTYTSNYVTVELGSIYTQAQTIKIIDILGKLSVEHKITDSTQKIDVSNLKKGIYFIQIKIGNSLISKKLIVE